MGFPHLWGGLFEKHRFDSIFFLLKTYEKVGPNLTNGVKLFWNIKWQYQNQPLTVIGTISFIVSILISKTYVIFLQA